LQKSHLIVGYKLLKNKPKSCLELSFLENKKPDDRLLE